MSDETTIQGDAYGPISSNQGTIIQNFNMAHVSLQGQSLFIGVPTLPPYFLGRDDLMADLVQQVISGQSLALAAEGLPGVGKTTMAVALAYHRDVLTHFSDGVLWGGLGRVPDVMTILAEWAEALGSDVSDKIEPESRSQAVHTLIGQKRLLLVIDDAWTREDAVFLRCGGPGCCHVLTTRDKAIAAHFSGYDQVVNVPTLADDPAFDLLQKLAPQATSVDPAAARRLSEAVGGLPLAIELLGGYLADPAAPERKYSPTAAQAALADLSISAQRLQLATQRFGSQDGPVTLQQTIELSLEDLPAETRHMFYALGAFAPKPATFSWSAALAVSQADDRRLSVLLDRNLLEVALAGDVVWLTLHQTLAEAAAARLPEEARAQHHSYYLALANEDRQAWQWIERNYEQIKWAWAQAEETLEALEMVWALGVYQNRRGLWQDNLAWANRGLTICQENGIRQTEGALLNNIGHVYDSVGQREKALAYYNRALPIMEEVGNRSGLAATLNNIGSVYGSVGQRDKTLAYYNRALLIMEEVGDRSGLATTLNNIGHVYDSVGQREKALAYYNRALPIMEEVGDRFGLATTLNNIGSVYGSVGQRDKALEYYNRALLAREEVGDRAGIAQTLNNIGSVYARVGKQGKALAYYHRALPIIEEVGDRYGLATTLNNIGSVYARVGQQDKALEYFRRVLPIIEEVGDRSGLATTLNNIGLAYDRVGQRDKALEYYHRALPIREEVGDRSGLATTLTNIGLVYGSVGQREKALEYYHRALPIMEEVGDRSGESVTRYNIAKSFRALGRLMEAVVELRQVVELDRLVQHPDLEADMALLAEVEAELAKRSI